MRLVTENMSNLLLLLLLLLLFFILFLFLTKKKTYDTLWLYHVLNHLHDLGI